MRGLCPRVLRGEPPAATRENRSGPVGTVSPYPREVDPGGMAVPALVHPRRRRHSHPVPGVALMKGVDAMKRSFVVLTISLLAASAAQAALVLDQEQARIRPGAGGAGWPVGGDVEYMLAQTVTVGVDGRLVQIEIPAICEGGVLVAEIRNVVAGAGGEIPGTRVLSRGSVPARELPPEEGFVFRTVDLEPAAPMEAGDEFAIVLKNETGRCEIGMGGSSDDYPPGRSVFRDVRTSPGAWLFTGGLGEPDDMAFRTFVETGRRGGSPSLCQVRGFGPVPIPGSVPVCHCIQDPVAREARCGFFHPSTFLVRTVPSPITAGQPFEVAWTILPLEPIEGVVEVDDVLPPGFQEPQTPLVFFGAQLPVGESLTLTYQAVAGQRPGSFKIETDVAIVDEQQRADEGTLRSVIEVAPQP